MITELDDLHETHPLTRRLLSSLPASLIELHDGSAIKSLGEGTVALFGEEKGILAIRLDSLERALTGFRDTGTWGDFFPPAAED